MSSKQSGLGKGLSAIFTENSIENENVPVTLKISEVKPNESQPRINFDDESLKELAESIAKHGIIQPLIVKPTVSGIYTIIAGERRFRASKMAGLLEVPVIIKDIDDAKIMEIALVENLQREDLSAIEEAKGYKVLMEAYNFTQDEVAKSVGKSRPYVANSLRLLTLPDAVLDKLNNDEITAGHARTLLSLSSLDDIKRALETTTKQGLNVRQLEQLVKKINFKEIEETKSLKVLKKDVFFNKIETDLEKALSRNIKIISGRNKKGTIQIEFFGEEDLSKIYKQLISIKKK